MTAKILSELPQIRRGVALERTYPWEEWTDGRVYLITKGEDFAVTIPSMQSTLRQWAQRHGLKVQVRRLFDPPLSIAFKFSQPLHYF